MEEVLDRLDKCCGDPTTCEDSVDCPEESTLPPGIKTEAVLMLLGNISNALKELVNGINSTITQIVTEGSREMEQTEGDENNGEQEQSS